MAVDTTVKVTGIQEVIKNLKRYQIIKTQAIKDIMMECGLKVEMAAKEMCPVDYGRLRASITTAKSGGTKPQIKSPCNKPENPSKSEDAINPPSGPIGLVVAIGTNVKYGPYVEHGAPKMPARPFLFPAYFMFEGEVLRRIGKVMKKDVKL